LVLSFVGIYALVAVNGPHSSLWNLSSADLILAGGNAHSPYGIPGLSYNTVHGQWWRLLTSTFLHGGLMHIAFNIYAMLLLAPQVREVFGGAKGISVYLLSGLVGAAVSTAWMVQNGSLSVSIGASGAICGFIGLMAAWGHTTKQSSGIFVRNSMIRWAVIIIVFGFFLGADNAAHVGGLVTGSLMGLMIKDRQTRSRIWPAIGTVSSLVLVAGAGIIVWLTFHFPALPIS